MCKHPTLVKAVGDIGGTKILFDVLFPKLTPYGLRLEYMCQCLLIYCQESLELRGCDCISETKPGILELHWHPAKRCLAT